MKPFYVEDYDKDCYMIFFEDKRLCGGCWGGSFHIIGARILGLSYPDYLRYMRDNYNATIKGREGYSLVYFKEQKNALLATQELNKAWATVEKALNQIEFDESVDKNVKPATEVINGKTREVRQK